MRLSRQRSGLTLLEVMLAMIIFSTVVVFVCGIWSLHSRIILKSRSRMVATFLAEQMLEECINDGFWACSQRVTPPTGTVLTMHSWSQGKEIDINYTYYLAVSTHPAFPNSLKVITVRVEFPDSPDSPYHEVRYETLIAKS